MMTIDYFIAAQAVDVNHGTTLDFHAVIPGSILADGPGDHFDAIYVAMAVHDPPHARMRLRFTCTINGKPGPYSGLITEWDTAPESWVDHRVAFVGVPHYPLIAGVHVFTAEMIFESGQSIKATKRFRVEVPKPVVASEGPATSSTLH